LLETFHQNKDKSLGFLHGEGAATSVENAGISYQSASLLSAGASTEQIAMLSTITNFVFALILFRVPALMKFSDSLKRAVVTLSVVSSLSWIPLILVSLFFTGISPSLLIILWVISLVPDFMVGPLRDKWLADIVPSGKLGRYLSLRTIISTGSYLGCFFVMGYALDHFHNGIFNGFSFVFVFAFAASLVSLVLYLVLKVPVPAGEPQQAQMGLFGFIKEVKQNELGIFIVFTSLVIFSSSICGTFFSVYMLKDLHFTYLTFTMVVSIEFVARIVSAQFWGKLIDNSGAVKALKIASFMIPVIPVLWLFSSNVGYLMAVQTISGITWGAFDLCTQTYLCRASPPEKRLHYIVYHRSIVTLASAAGPLLGAGLLDLIYPIFGSQILSIFLLSGILRFLVVIGLVPHLKDDNTASDSAPQYSGFDSETRPSRVELEPYRRKTIYPKPVRETWRSLEFGDVHRVNWKTGLASKPEKAIPAVQVNRVTWSRAVKAPVENENTFIPLIRRRITPLTAVRAETPSSENLPKVARLKDNLSRDIEYHKRWASRVPVSTMS
jgi:MFS family permease